MSLIAIIQIIISLALIALIIIQERSSGTSGIFGGGEGAFYQRRRGLERWAFIATILLVIAFAGLSLVNLVQ